MGIFEFFICHEKTQFLTWCKLYSNMTVKLVWTFEKWTLLMGFRAILFFYDTNFDYSTSLIVMQTAYDNFFKWIYEM